VGGKPRHARCSRGADGAFDYKALVCIFMYGGNDHANTVVPYDNASYQLYAQSRTNLTLPQTALLPLTTPNNASMSGRQVSLRSELQPLKTIYDAGKAAVLANVGTLVVPTNMTQYRARSVPLPPSLFSHNDQQSVWQTYDGRREGARVGWGGRAGDLLASSNQYPNFTCVSASGTAVFLSGQSTVQMQIGNNGGLAITALTGTTLFGSSSGPATARRLMTEDRGNLLEKDYNTIVKRSAEAAQTLNSALTGFRQRPRRFRPFPTPGSATSCATCSNDRRTPGAGFAPAGLSCRDRWLRPAFGTDQRPWWPHDRTRRCASSVLSGDRGARCGRQRDGIHRVRFRPHTGFER
jgi:uncharacterized protein (DUF1501 family)